jgi:hypothetical protein
MPKDRSRNDKGIILEQIVAMLHEVDGVKVETNAKLSPKSGDNRKIEIDVLLTSFVAGYPVRIAIQCKNYEKKITREQIGAFKDSLDDAGIPHQHGIVVSVHGYQSGAVKRAKEIGIKTLILEGLSKTRLTAEIKASFQYFAYLLLVVEKMEIQSPISSYYAWFFLDENQKPCGFFTDLIVAKWRNHEIPAELGEYDINLKLPKGWYQFVNDKPITPQLLSAKVRVVAYLAEIEGESQEFKLREADSKEINKHFLKADFDAAKNLIKASKEKPVFSEEELTKLKKMDSKINIEHRIRLPKILHHNNLEPISKKAWKMIEEKTENLNLKEIAMLTKPTFEDIEGTKNLFMAMSEEPRFGFPVIIDDENGNLIDIGLLLRNKQFKKVLGYKQLLNKYHTPEFAKFILMANEEIGRQILGK